MHDSKENNQSGLYVKYATVQFCVNLCYNVRVECG